MTTLKQIAKFARDHYRPLEPNELEQEAKRLTGNLEKKSAGRVCETFREDFEEIKKFCEMKRVDPPKESPWPIKRTLCDLGNWAAFFCLTCRK